MDTRLRYWMSAATLFYSLWMGTALILHYQHTVPFALGAITLGIIIGVMSVFLVTDAKTGAFLTKLFILTLLMILLAMLSILFGTAALQSNFVFGYMTYFGERVIQYRPLLRYLGGYGLLGAAVGFTLWLVSMIQVLLLWETPRHYAMAIVMLLVILLMIPQVGLFEPNLTLFALAAITSNLIVTLMMPFIPVRQQAFWFGFALGAMLVVTPFLGFFANGVLLQR